MVYEFYQGLPSNYEDYEDIVLPKRESMREKTRREGVYGYYDHWNKDAYTWIEKFLEDSVGKKFDNIYPKVCEKFRKKKDLEFREEFKSRIDPHDMSDIHWHRNDYYLDDNHIIRRYKPLKKDKRRKYVLELDRSEDYYVVDKKKLLEYPEIMLYLKSKLGKDIEYIILSSDRLTEALGKKVQECIGEAIGRLSLDRLETPDCWHIDWVTNHKYRRLSMYDFIKCCYDSVNKTYYEGSPEYSKHYYENRDAERKSRREYKTDLEETHEQMLINSLIRSKVNSIVSNIISDPSIPVSLGDINRITKDVEEWVKQKRKKKTLN